MGKIDSPIAELDLIGIEGVTGRRLRIAIRIGKPYKRDRWWRCPVSMDGMGPAPNEKMPEIAGEDSLQSLCLTLRLVGALLSDFVKAGGRLFHYEDGINPETAEDKLTEFPLDAYFKEFGGS